MPKGRYITRRPKVINSTHKMFADTALGRFVLQVITPSELYSNQPEKRKPGWAPLEPGDTVYVVIPDRNGFFKMLNLTEFNEEELAFVEGIFAKAFKLARPIVQERDKHAADVEAEPGSKHVFDRLHRSVPELYAVEGYE